MKQNYSILFDIDYTLLDTSKLRELTQSRICSFTKMKKGDFGLLDKRFSSTLKSSIEFSPQKYIQFLVGEIKLKGLRGELLSLFFREKSIYKKALYPEVIATLRELKAKHRLGIFSEGDFKFQMTKLKLTGVEKYLDKNLIFIYPYKAGKAEELAKKIKNLVIIDDNIEHIKNLLPIKRVTPIWIKQGLKAVGAEIMSVLQITSLNQLLNVLC